MLLIDLIITIIQIKNLSFISLKNIDLMLFIETKNL